MQCTTGRFRVIAGPATVPYHLTHPVSLLYVAGPVLNHGTHTERCA